MEKKKRVVTICVNMFQAKNIGTPIGKTIREFHTFWENQSSLRHVSLSQGARKVRAAETTVLVIPYIFLSV